MSEIAAMPGVDLVFEKGENMGHMAERIRAVLHEKEEQRRLQDDAEVANRMMAAIFRAALQYDGE